MVHLQRENSAKKSYFFSETLCRKCTEDAIFFPDALIKQDNKLIAFKSFNYNIGKLGYSERFTKNVKVVFTHNTDHFFVITSFPVV